MSVPSLETTSTVPGIAMSERSRDLFALHLSAGELETLLYLAGQMKTGNRVTINQSRIATAIRVSRETVRRALIMLRATRLLLDPDDGLPMVNPLYFVHNPAEHDQLASRFGIEAVAVERPARRPKTTGGRHLEVVR